MSKREPTQEVFLVDVSNHKMSIKLDQGVYRHIHFSNPGGRSNQWFEIITTPWLFILNGDMGTWCFSRLEDMFNFFRSDSGKINPSYWSEKLCSGQGGRQHDISGRYDGDTFKANVIYSLDNYGLSEDKVAEIVKALDDIDFYESEHEVRDNLENQLGVDDFEFQDLWEVSSKGWVYQYIWCCHAIVWGIQQYDQSRKEENSERQPGPSGS